MKRAIDSMIKSVLKVLGGEGFANPQFSSFVLLKHFVQQKIFRINSHVPWPVHKSSIVHAPKKIDRGNRCPGLSPWCYLDGRNGIVIGDNTWMGPRVSIISMNHDIYDYKKYIEDQPIKIGKNSWLGAGVTILPGVELGEHTIVAAGSVVTKSHPSNVVLAGVPAKVVKEIGEYGASDLQEELENDSKIA